MESACLQVRKILELIAFGSLVANKHLYSKLHSDFAKHWHAGNMLKALEHANPNFYPKPVIETASDDPNIVHQLKNRDTDYLSKDELEEVYGRCGLIMHACNPYRPEIDYSEYTRMLQQWRQRIINLLNNHQVHLVNDLGFYLIHMKENQDDKVHFYRFQPPGQTSVLAG